MHRGPAAISRAVSTMVRPPDAGSVALSAYGGPAVGARVDGVVAPGWEAVRDAFEGNFRAQLESAAQFCVYQGDRPVVDLAGRAEHPTAALDYDADTLQCIFSSGKNMEVVAMARMVDSGLLSYDQPVREIWPEFGSKGKESVTVADVMRHEGGAPCLTADPANPAHDFELDSASMAVGAWAEVEKLVEQTRFNPASGGEGRGPRLYHGTTRGFLVNGILRRVDPRGRTLSALARDDICGPLGAAVLCGLTPAEERTRAVAPMVARDPEWLACEVGAILANPTHPLREVLASQAEGGEGGGRLSLTARGMQQIDFWRRDGSPFFVANTIKGRALEIPSLNHQGNARSIARVNSVMANGGSLGPVRVLSERACALAHAAPKTAFDPFQARDTIFTQGGFAADIFANDLPGFVPGFFGWTGSGGSLSLWSPERRIAIGFTVTGFGVDMHGRVRDMLEQVARASDAAAGARF